MVRETGRRRVPLRGGEEVLDDGEGLGAVLDIAAEGLVGFAVGEEWWWWGDDGADCRAGDDSYEEEDGRAVPARTATARFWLGGGRRWW